MKKTFFIGANWKMNPIPSGALDANSPYRSSECEIVVFPTLLDLPRCIAATLNAGAQCGRAEAKGAFTGDISMSSLKETGATHVLCGHSERRLHHHETDADIAAQVGAALECGLTPILCIGETEEEKQHEETKNVLRKQLHVWREIFKRKGMSEAAGLAGPAAGGLNKGKGWSTEGKPLGLPSVIIAYEPIWAIGTGKTPQPKDVDAIHAFIKAEMGQSTLRVIYGGSMNGSNAESFLSQPNIDGGLVGGASLQPNEFAAIVGAAKNI